MTATDLPHAGFLDLLGDLDPVEQDAAIAALSQEEAEAADGDWGSWAHDGQSPPEGDWRT